MLAHMQLGVINQSDSIIADTPYFFQSDDTALIASDKSIGR